MVDDDGRSREEAWDNAARTADRRPARAAKDRGGAFKAKARSTAGGVGKKKKKKKKKVAPVY
jgi:hypothetical protein